jgi:hypothetical protein
MRVVRRVGVALVVTALVVLPMPTDPRNKGALKSHGSQDAEEELHGPDRLK